MNRAGAVAAYDNRYVLPPEATLSIIDQQIWDLLQELERLSHWSPVASEISSSSNQPPVYLGVVLTSATGEQWQVAVPLPATPRQVLENPSWEELVREESGNSETAPSSGPGSSSSVPSSRLSTADPSSKETTPPSQQGSWSSASPSTCAERSWEFLYDLAAARRKTSGCLTYSSLCWEEDAEREEERRSLRTYAAAIFDAIEVALADLGFPDNSVETILFFLGVVDTGNHYLEDLVDPQEERQSRSRGWPEAD